MLRDSRSSCDVLIAGAGLAGSVVARQMAEAGYQVHIMERRSHIAGNAYDELDEAGILVHRYGPHIFHTNSAEAWDFLSRFTNWAPYEHRVLGNIRETLIPIPFNHKSLLLSFGEKRGEELYQLLIEHFGKETKVPISELRKTDNPDLSELADYVYDNVFLHYTLKQWGSSPDEIDPAVTGRVPVHISDDDRYFQDAYQGMPSEGYTTLIQRMLNHHNITVELDVDALDYIELKNRAIFVDGQKFEGVLVFTGQVDELFDFTYGELPYRSLDMKFETLQADSFQEAAVVNYTVSEDFTRITEFKKLTGQEVDDVTTIMREYPEQYDYKSNLEPYYPIPGEKNLELYNRYMELANQYSRLFLVGRLAQYRYFDMDKVIVAALEVSGNLIAMLEDTSS